jgi:ABC-type transport system substrate-binding protein
VSSYWENILKSRTSRRRVLTAGAATSAAAVSLSLIGCGSDDKDTAKDPSGLLHTPKDTDSVATKGGNLPRVSANNGFDVTRGGVDASLAATSYSRLVKWKTFKYPEKPLNQVEPDAAVSWEVAPDALSVTYKLRPNMKFDPRPPTNGRVMTSADVKYSWELFESKSAARANLAHAADPYSPVTGVVAPDANTVTVNLAFPYAPLTEMLAQGRHLPILPVDAESSYNFRIDMRSTGAWRLKEYIPDVQTVYEKNRDWYDADKIYLDQLTYHIIPQYPTGLAQFRAGALAAYEVQQEDILPTKRDLPKLLMAATDQFDDIPYWLRFGYLPDSPFRDDRVRKAASMTIDRDLYIAIFSGKDKFEAAGLQVPTAWHSCLGAGEVWWLDPKDTKLFGEHSRWFQFDPAEAKKLASAAGFNNVIESKFTLSGSPGQGSFSRPADVLVGMWNDSKVFNFRLNYVDLNSVFRPQYHYNYNRHEGIIIGGGGSPYPDIDGNLQVNFRSGQDRTGYVAADGKPDAYVDGLIEKQRTERDLQKRKALIDEFQRYFASKMYTLFEPGDALGFELAQPWFGNWKAFSSRSGTEGSAMSEGGMHYWIDNSKKT